MGKTEIVPVDEQVCRKCEKLLPAIEFYSDHRTKGGLRFECKACTPCSDRGAVYYRNNAEHLKQKQKEWKAAHPKPKSPKQGNRKDFTGQRFGRLVALERRIPRIDADGFPRGSSRYWCRCDCGNELEVDGSSLNTGTSTSCGCKRIESIRARQGKRPLEYKYNLLVSINQRTRPHLEISLTYEEFMGFTKIDSCHYCSAKIKWVTRACDREKLGYSYNLDRKDNDIGYTKDNCVVCCGRCNFAKGSSFTYEEWKHIGRAIREFRERNLCQQEMFKLVATTT